MNQHALHLEWHTLDQAGASIRAAFLPYVEKNLRDGLHLAVTVQELEDSKTQQQRDYLHGVIYREIAEQATIDGKKYDLKVWKKYLQYKYLGDEVVEYTDPMTGEIWNRNVPIRSEDLGVRGYSKLIDEVTAFAVTDLHVMFSVPKWQEYRE